MRLLALVSLCFAGVCAAQAPTPAEVQDVFPLAGIQVLCEQTEPLLRRGLPDDAAGKLGQNFNPASLCGDLAKRVAAGLTTDQIVEVKNLLQGSTAQFFNQAELAVGAGDAQAFTQYRQQLSERPPRGARVELMRRLDAAAHTTDLAHLLRYEVGKTQAWLVLRGRGEAVTEEALTAGTQAESQAIRDSSAQGVEAFMLYAYRQIPSEQVLEYVELYEQPSLAALYGQLLGAIPQVFAERRAQLP